MSHARNKLKKMRRRARRFPWVFPEGRWTEPFALQARWNVSKQTTRESLTPPKPFV